MSAEWLAALNDTLDRAGPAPLEADGAFRVVLEFLDGPSSAPHALTFTITPEGASADLGDHLAAEAMIRLSYRDAEALTSGSLDSAGALRDGRLKVRGDVHGLVPLLGWLVAGKEPRAS